MNQYLKNLNKIEFIVTYACTGRCKHCSEGDHTSCSERIDPQIAADAVRKIAAEYDIKTVMTYTDYQLLNTVPIARENMLKFLAPSFEMYRNVQNDSTFLRYQINVLSDTTASALRKVSADNCRHKTVIDMMRRTPLFEFTDLYADTRYDICKSPPMALTSLKRWNLSHTSPNIASVERALSTRSAKTCGKGDIHLLSMVSASQETSMLIARKSAR